MNTSKRVFPAGLDTDNNRISLSKTVAHTQTTGKVVYCTSAIIVLQTQADKTNESVHCTVYTQ